MRLIIMSCCRCGFPWLFLAIRPNHPSFPAGLLDYNLCPYRAVVDRFLLVVNTCMSVWRGSLKDIAYVFVFTSPAMSHISCSSYLNGFRDGDRWPYSCCFVGCCFLDFSIQLITFLWDSRLAFSRYAKSASMWCIYLVMWTRTLLGENCVLFCRIGLTFLWLITYR